MAIAQQRLDELWDFSDAEESEVRLRTALEEETDAASRAELQTQVARALGLQGRFDEADRVLDDVSVEDTSVAARAALERGRLRNSAGDPHTAVPYFLAALDAAGEPDLVFLRIDALHMLAIADPGASDQWTAQALETLADVDDPRTLRWTVSLHNNAGWSHFDAGRTTDAIAAFQAAKDAAARWGTSQQRQWADEALAEALAARDAPS